ncbi:MAG: hypothetical protein IT560_11455 [Alphaproteobacteria bacterium]|nr:hypothetical protein [Alphaproteobacteria bacterium]
MSGEAYAELLRRKKSGLRLISLLAPARSSSTALERALSGSPDIRLQVNDPFAIYDEAAREEKTYEYILSRLEEHDGAATALVKNVADYIPPGDAWLRWRDLCDGHIFLIRNPLLTLHSLFKMMVRHGDPAELDAYARETGYADGAALQNALADGDDFSRQGNLYRTLFTRDKKIHRDRVMQIPVLLHMSEEIARDAGHASLDTLAQSVGDNNWAATKQRLQKPDASLAGFDKVLARIFACRITGWEALYQHFTATPDAIVMDSTMFRSAPEDAMRSLSRSLDIRYADSMRAWQGEGKAFTTDYDGDVPYYDRVVKSQRVDPPTEKPVPLDAFPPQFQHHLAGAGGCFDIYLRMMAKIDPAFAASFALTGELQTTDPVFAAACSAVFGKPATPPDPAFADVADIIKQLS